MAAKERGGCARAFGIVSLATSGLVLLAIAGFVVLVLLTKDVQVPPTSITLPASAQVTRRRLFFEEHRQDDGARAMVFRQALREGELRCDAFVSVLMSAPGAWTVRCTPGHLFVLKFRESGELQDITQIR